MICDFKFSERRQQNEGWLSRPSDLIRNGSIECLDEKADCYGRQSD